MNKKENKEISKNYYTDTGKKVIDFLIGFFGSYIVYTIFSFIAGLILPLADGLFSYGFEEYSIALPFLFMMTIIIIFICSIWFAFKFNRRFIAFGIITALSLPLLAFGACFTILGAFSLF